MFNSSKIEVSRVIYGHYYMKISRIKIMTDTSKCNDDDDGVKFTRLWLVYDHSAPTDVFPYRLKSKCLYVFLEILYFYIVDIIGKVENFKYFGEQR